MRAALLTSVLPLAAAGLLAMAPDAPGAAHDSLPPVRASRLTSSITVDGLLSEAAWQGEPAITRLTQSDPLEGLAPSESTTVWLAYDDAALYVAARCWDPQPDSIVAKLVRRDLWVVSDRVFIFLDPFHDHRSGYFFSVSAAGVLYDGTLHNDDWQDQTWDGVWDARASVDQRGWTCEMRIPFSQMRFRPGAEQVWGVNFRRRIERRSELDQLVYTPKKESGFVSRFPHLFGIENGHRSRSIEVLPYSTGKAEYLVRRSDDPFHDGSRYTPGAGGDLRMAVGNSLTLNATMNPDFGQVEVDPAVVNLSDVESFFQEKRPFFTEGQRIFSFGNEGANDYWGFNWPEPAFFYSRRVGRAPQGAVPQDADFSDVPMATHILGAARLTGKPAPSWNFGTLHAITSQEQARYASGDLRSDVEVEPLSYYGVTRGQKEFKGGRNGLGAMTSLVQRRFDGSDLRDALNQQSLMLGLDGWRFLDRKKVWVLSGWTAMSRVAGTEARMTRLQRNPRHYLQRPDAKHLGVDSSATALTGYGTRLWLHKQEGSFLFNSAVGFMDPRFDVNDIGYQSRADVVNAHAGAGYSWTVPNGWRKRAWAIGSAFRSGNFDGATTGGGVYLGSNVTFVNDYVGNAEFMYNPAMKSDRRTRGGPLMREDAGSYAHLHLDTDRRQKISYCINLEGGATPASNTSNWATRPTVLWNPVSNFSMEFGPGFERVIEDAQYVREIHDPGNVPANFGDRRYVFARMDLRTVSANVRLNISFTPNLSLQTFIQPLVSAGRYMDFKELASAGGYDFVHYGRDNGSTYDPATASADPDGPGPAPAFDLGDPSFNFKSLRGNAVLRWEYRPGSALYLVWTQERTDEQDTGSLRLRPSLTRLLDTRANNIFLTKVTYYFNV